MTPTAYINVEKRTLEFAEPIEWHTSTVAKLDRIPLFTQRTWVGLDEVEIIGCTCECIDESKFNIDCAIDFARAIEAKLKERNT